MLAAISLGISILAILISLGAFYYTKRQVQIMEGQESRREREEEDLKTWALKFDEAVRVALKIGPAWIHTTQYGAATNALGVVCPDPGLRQRIETYLVNHDRGDNFSPRQTSSDLLRMPIVQRTITELLECVERFTVEDPANAKTLGLLELPCYPCYDRGRP